TALPHASGTGAVCRASPAARPSETALHASWSAQPCPHQEPHSEGNENGANDRPLPVTAHERPADKAGPLADPDRADEAASSADDRPAPHRDFDPSALIGPLTNAGGESQSRSA